MQQVKEKSAQLLSMKIKDKTNPLYPVIIIILFSDVLKSVTLKYFSEGKYPNPHFHHVKLWNGPTGLLALK